MKWGAAGGRSLNTPVHKAEAVFWNMKLSGVKVDLDPGKHNEPINPSKSCRKYPGLKRSGKLHEIKGVRDHCGPQGYQPRENTAPRGERRAMADQDRRIVALRA